MAKQYLIPGGGYFNETGLRQELVPGWFYVNETQPAPTPSDTTVITGAGSEGRKKSELLERVSMLLLLMD